VGKKRCGNLRAESSSLPYESGVKWVQAVSKLERGQIVWEISRNLSAVNRFQESWISARGVGDTQ
jgi:hypothetical protein